MKTPPLKIMSLLAAALTGHAALAQSFNSGSTGAYGPMNITSNTTLNLPPDGIFHCTTIFITNGATLKFNRNVLNTPVYLLATSNVSIFGTIDVSGISGLLPNGGLGGPGGFNGGEGGFDVFPGGDGQGPGGGRGRTSLGGPGDPGAGGYATKSTYSSSTNHGAAYGSPLLIPLVGGSGGGGNNGTPGVAGGGGGGGGGALLIASSTRITLVGPGAIYANGGTPAGGVGYASGGAVRLVAPVVASTVPGQGAVQALGGGSVGGEGRIRIDTTDRTGLVGLSLNGRASFGSFMAVFPGPVPRLDILDAAGTAIPEGNADPVSILLPFGSTTNRAVTVQARDFNASVPISVVLTPESGPSQTYQTNINNTVGNNPATVTVNVTVPVNTKVAVNAWTR